MKTRTNNSESVHELTAAELQSVNGGVKAIYDDEGNLVATCTHYVDSFGWLRPLHIPPYDMDKTNITS